MSYPILIFIYSYCSSNLLPPWRQKREALPEQKTINSWKLLLLYTDEKFNFFFTKEIRHLNDNVWSDPKGQ